MQDRDFCLSEEHQELGWLVHAERAFADPGVCAFEHAFIRECAAAYVPAYCSIMCEDSLEVIHAQWQGWLGSDEWALFGWFGKQAARKSGLVVNWGGDVPGGNPRQWQVC